VRNETQGFLLLSFFCDDALLTSYQEISCMAGSSVLPACLPDPGEKFEAGYICTACGWGRLRESKLLKVFFDILISQCFCQSFIPVFFLFLKWAMNCLANLYLRRKQMSSDQ